MLNWCLEILIYAFAWRARGAGFWGIFGQEETTVCRVFASCIMAAGTGCLHNLSSLQIFIYWILLGVSLVFGVDPYRGVAISGDAGPLSDPPQPLIGPVLALLRLPTATTWQRRVWGTAGMAIRMAFAAPALVYLACATHHGAHLYFAFASAAAGLGYLACGFISSSDQNANGEVFAGSILGVIPSLVV